METGIEVKISDNCFAVILGIVFCGAFIFMMYSCEQMDRQETKRAEIEATSKPKPTN